MEMTYSIIIPTKDRPKYLQNCLKSIVKQNVLPQELIIVDASTNAISEINEKNCKSLIPDDIKFIFSRCSQGVTRQRNKGAEKANSDILFFIDDDEILKEDYSEKILAVYHLKSDRALGGVQGTCVGMYAEKRLNNLVKKIFFLTRAATNEKSRFLPSMGYVFNYMPDDIIEVEAMPGGYCTFYREVFNQFKFDEVLKRCTDLDITYRVSRHYKLFQTPEATLSHNIPSTVYFSNRGITKEKFINTYYMVRKHLPKGNVKWLAYYWSVVGELLLNTAKSCIHLNPDPIIGTLSGICEVLKKK